MPAIGTIQPALQGGPHRISTSPTKKKKTHVGGVRVEASDAPGHGGADQVFGDIALHQLAHGGLEHGRNRLGRQNCLHLHHARNAAVTVWFVCLGDLLSLTGNTGRAERSLTVV